MRQTLYTIAEDQRLINAMLEENGGELTPEQQQAQPRQQELVGMPEPPKVPMPPLPDIDDLPF